MRSRWLCILGMVGGLLTVTSATADDFGDLLEKAAKDALNKQFSAENLDHALAPFQLNADIRTIKTLDGWDLVVHHYHPMGPRRADAMPVVLCHGLSYSALFWDLEPRASFAQYLSAKGYDVWSVSLRGCGLSQKWVWKLDAAGPAVLGGAVRKLTKGQIAPAGYASIDPKYAQWNLDDHIAFDVPAIVKHVRQQTGAKEIAWVGHSMGGIIALGHLVRHGNPGIGKLVTVGSQVTMPEGQLVTEYIIEMIKTRERQLTSKLTQKELVADTRTSVNNIFFNEKHVSGEVYVALTTWANDIPSVGLLKQYKVLADRGELWDAKKEYNYAANLHQIKVPVLITCGQRDQLAPPVVQQYLHERIGSRDKSLVIFGRRQGLEVNAGHNDVLVGQTSRQDVYPVIERWLRP